VCDLDPHQTTRLGLHKLGVNLLMRQAAVRADNGSRGGALLAEVVDGWGLGKSHRQNLPMLFKTR
jgi:hypothetical protein